MGKIFKKTVDGIPVMKALRNIVIEKDGMSTYNPTVGMALADGWTEITVADNADMDEKKLLARSKRSRLIELRNHDESFEVNDCIIVKDGRELHYWAGKTDRDSLKGALKDYMSLGHTEYRLDFRELGVYIWIPCEKLLQILAILEVYASKCYNKTTDHEFAIKACTTIEEVDTYNFRTGYPDIPKFEL